jgi:hypothetical protein
MLLRSWSTSIAISKWKQYGRHFALGTLAISWVNPNYEIESENVDCVDYTLKLINEQAKSYSFNLLKNVCLFWLKLILLWCIVSISLNWREFE